MTKERFLSVVMHAAVVSTDLLPRITPWQITSPAASTKLTYPTVSRIYLHLVRYQYSVLFTLGPQE